MTRARARVERVAAKRRLRVAVAALLCVSFTLARAEGVDFALPDLAGVERKLSEFRGKWVVVNFWATWCPPCLEEIPQLVAFHQRHKDRDAVVVGVNFEEIDPFLLEDFVEEQGMTYPVLLAGSSPLVPFEPLQGLPSTFIVTPGGELVARHVGPIDGAALEAFLARESRRGDAQSR